MRGRVGRIAAAVAAFAGAAFALGLERLGTGRIATRHPVAAAVAVDADGMFLKGVSGTGEAVFAEGIELLEPAPGLPMGAFTETGDWAAATQGEVKAAVRAAARAFAAREPGAAVGEPPAYTASGDDLPVCLGQLKTAAAPFWRHLVASGATVAAPWSEDGADDLALVNRGQVKAAFAFGLPESGNGPAVPADERADADGDGLPDIVETGGVRTGDGLPWLAFDACDDLTGEFEDGRATWPLPVPLRIGDATVTNMVLDARGVLVFPRAEAGAWWPYPPWSLASAAERPDVLLVAPYWTAFALLREADGSTRVRAGRATHGGREYLLVEYADARGRDDGTGLSFQVAVPLAVPDRAYVRYRGVAGADMDGRLARIGFQMFHGRPCASFCDRQEGRVRDGLELRMYFGHGTDPADSDSDGDGLRDGDEVEIGVDPANPDTDADGMLDGWEWEHGLDPTDPSDAEEDPDGDGLCNADEYACGSNPNEPDTDGDGACDGEEFDKGGDPADARDGGGAAAPDRIRWIQFDVGGDYAAWELTVAGEGPEDFRTLRLAMTRPNATGRAKLGLWKGNAYRLSMKWLNCRGHEDDEDAPWYCWALHLDGLPGRGTYSVGTGSASRNQLHAVICGKGWILDNAQGLATWHTCTNRRTGRNIAQRLAAMLYVLDDPCVAFDYDHDGRIDDDEVDRARKEDPVFRFWINDDADSGDVCPDTAYLSDRPGTGDNARDGKVGGRRDLVDFTSAWIDADRVFPPSCPQALRRGLFWQLKGPVNAVWSRAARWDADGFQLRDAALFGENLDRAACRADTWSLKEWTSPPRKFLEQMEEAGGGLVLLEGREKGRGLSIRCGWGANADDLSATAKLEIDDVEKMYRWLCLRDVCGGGPGAGSRLGDPPHRPDATCDDRHFVFVHGFNINVEEARATGAEVFKRLWQSGLESRFTVVDWFGDDSQFGAGLAENLPVETLCPNYYVNVLHAFQSARALAERANALGGQKVFLAHSLGNMLVSAAAADHGLGYVRYYMLNAAVAQEAYNEEAQADEMIAYDWGNVPKSYRAAGWHGLFPADDFRASLTWRGRFRGLRDVVNCYSATENVVGNKGGLILDPVWKLQEKVKGTTALHVINGATVGYSQIACEGGWGVNTHYALDPRYYLLWFMKKVSELKPEEVIVHPLFTPFRTEPERMHATNRFEFADADEAALLRAKFLADAVPAESWAMGGNALAWKESACGNLQLDTLNNMSGQWPSERSGRYARTWLHSDLKNVAYFYIYPLFDRIVNGY